MADNSIQSGSDIIRDIDKGGVKTQVMVLDIGGGGAESLASGTNRMPVAVDELIYLLGAILEKMPRVDTADRLMISHAESNPTVAISSAQTLATLTTLGTMTNIGGRDAAHASYALANMGALHIYDNIRVS